MRLLVTGASGYVGSRLVGALVSAGHEVVVSSRDPDAISAFGWADRVSTVAMDVDDPASIRSALTQSGPIDALYYLVHGIGRSGFADTDRAAAAHVATAARDAGVARIVYLGGFVPTDGRPLSAHLRSRTEVGEALAVADGPQVVWLRAAVIVGAGSTSFEIIRYLADRFAVIPEPSWMNNAMDPISIRDVVHYLVAAGDPALPAGSYDLAGPDVGGCYRSILEAYLDAIRTPRLRIPAPPVSTRLAGHIGALAVPVPSSLTTELVTSLDHPMAAGEHRIRELVPPPSGGLTTMRSAVEAATRSPHPRPVTELVDLHHLADTDPSWAGGDWLRVRLMMGETVRAALRLATALAS